MNITMKNIQEINTKNDVERRLNMRKYNSDTKQELTQVQCNICKKYLKVKNGIIMEGVFSVDYNWGYFSKKDGEIHSFDLCEDCYDFWVKTFDVPFNLEENNEMI